MSLEAKIEALTAAVIANTAALQAAAGAKATHSAGKAEKQAEKVAEKPAEKPAERPEVSYDDVKVPFLALVKKDRAKALEVIGAKPFGLSNLKDAKPEQYAGLLDAILKAGA